MDKFIKIDKISKHFKHLKVLNNITFDVREGEFIVLLGPSGCGKSTLLNIIAGLITDYEGDVFFKSINVNHYHPKDRNIGFVFQNYALYPNMSVYDNMAFSLKFKNINSKEFNFLNNDKRNLSKKELIDYRVKEIATLLNIEELLNKHPNELSGGQSQRVAIGRALVRKPDVFLFDEPLSNLDAKLRRKLRTEIKDIHKLIKTTVIYVTHDQEEALTLADKIIIMDNGTIQQIGTPKQIYFEPKNEFVARFIGNPPMNILTIDKKFIEFLKKQQLHNFVDEISGFKSIGIRPEYIYSNRKNSTDIEIKIKIDSKEFTGDKKIISANIVDTNYKIQFIDSVDANLQNINSIFLDKNYINKFKN